METVYIETTIVSYLVANPSRDLVVAARQAITDEWWREARGTYRCVTSDEVIREASLGDADMTVGDWSSWRPCLYWTRVRNRGGWPGS